MIQFYWSNEFLTLIFSCRHGYHQCSAGMLYRQISQLTLWNGSNLESVTTNCQMMDLRNPELTAMTSNKHLSKYLLPEQDPATQFSLHFLVLARFHRFLGLSISYIEPKHEEISCRRNTSRGNFKVCPGQIFAMREFSASDHIPAVGKSVLGIE